MKRWTVIFGFFSATNGLQAANWCSHSPDSVYIGLPPIEVNFSNSCRGHDICYFSLGSSKYGCDRKFLGDLRQTCRDRFTSWAHRLHREKCLLTAEAYHEGLISGLHELDRKSYESAQAETQETIARVSACSSFGGDLTLQMAESLATLQAEGATTHEAINRTVEKYCHPGVFDVAGDATGDGDVLAAGTGD